MSDFAGMGMEFVPDGVNWLTVDGSTTNSMSRALLPYAQTVEDLDRIADAVARPAPNGANHSRF